jgi:hypothetical protein
VKLVGDGDEVAKLAKFHGGPIAATLESTNTKPKSINPNSILDRINRRA